MSLPAGWASHDSAALLKWPHGRDELEIRYGKFRDRLLRPSKGSRQLSAVFDLATELGASQVLLESPYVDLDFRSEFSQHFSRRFRPPPDSSERLIFLDSGGQALGYCVIRPTPKPVGRTVMNVPERLERYVTCRAEQELLAYGSRFRVSGFPFMSQDGEYGRCAHAAVWSIARFHHAAHDTGRHSIAAIVDVAGTGPPPDRTAMSGGLTVAEVRQALRGLGLPVLAYPPRRRLKDTTFSEVMCRYLDSGFPIAINTFTHSTVLVGYGREASGQIRWIRCDDNFGPYEIVPSFDPSSEPEPELGEWRSALVAVPGRIHVPAENAQAAAELTFERQLGAADGPKHLRDRWQAGRLEFRTFAVRPAIFKEELLRERQLPWPLIQFYTRIPTPVWAWLSEIRDVEEKEGLTLGTIMIDATSSKQAPEAVAADIDGWCVYFDPADRPVGTQHVQAPLRYPSRLPDRIWRLP